MNIDLDPIMPFGNHEGLRVSELPTHYLNFLLKQFPAHRLAPAWRRELESR